MALTSLTNFGLGAFDIKDSLHYDDLPCSGEADRTMMLDEIALDYEHQSLAFDLSGLELGFTPGQHPEIEFPESFLPPEGLTIDLAILDDNHSRDLEPAERTATIPVSAAILRKFLVRNS